MSLTIRRILGHDALTSEMAFALFSLDKDFFPTPWTLDSWKNLFNEHDRFLSVVLLNHDLIGFSLYDLVREDSFAHLLKIIVHPQFREQMIAQKLLVENMHQQRIEGIQHFFLEVEEENHAAQKLYQKCGFKVVHKKKNFYSSGATALIMTADLP